MPKRIMLIVGCLAVMVLLLATCAQPGQLPPPAQAQPTAVGAQPTTAPAQPTTASAGEPRTGGKVTIAIGTEPDLLDPQFSVGSTWSVMVMLALYDTLIFPGPDGTFQPGLAESWEFSDDAKTFTLHLRQDVKFHDGTPFNAEAVKYSFERTKDPNARSGAGFAFLQPDKIASIDTPDEYTVVINYTEPFAPFTTGISGPNLAPVSPAAVQQWGEEFGRHPVGTGPYKLKEWVSGSHITLERNPDYKWAPPFFQNRGAGYLDEITFRFIQENQTRLATLETGESQIIEAIPPAEVARFRDNPEFQVIERIPPGNGVIAQLNFDKFPGNSKEVRLAMNYAIDQEAINQSLFRGVFDPAYGPVSPSTPCYWEGVEGYYKHDVEKAKKILADAGFKDTDGDGIVELNGEPVRFEFLFNSGVANWPEIAEAIQAQMKEVGIDLVLKGSTGPAYFAAAREGQQGMNIMWYERNDPDILRVLFHSSSAAEGGFNRGHYRNAELDELLEKGNASGNLDTRCEFYQKAQELLMQDAVLLPASNRIAYWGADADVKGIVMPLTQPYYQDMYLAK